MDKPTQKQEKLIKLILDNLGNKKNTRTLRDMMREVGYSEAQCKNPKQILNTKAVKEGTQDFLKSLRDKRKLAITHLTEDKLKTSGARDLASITDTFTKNIQLLEGKPTENINYKISKAEQEKIDNLLE